MTNGSIEDDVRALAESLRQEAGRKLALAEHLKASIFKAPVLVPPIGTQPLTPRTAKAVPAAAVEPGHVDLEVIKSILKTRKARIGDLAKQYGVSEHSIRVIVDPDDSGISIGKQGWMSIKKEHHHEHHQEANAG